MLYASIDASCTDSMASIYLSTIQGIVAGGTAAYLHGRAQQETKLQAPDTWISTALQVNHVLLLTAETMRFAAIPLNGFGTLAQITYALTPLALAAGLRNKITLFEAKCAQRFTTLYRLSVIVASVATALLGNPAFALASLSMLAIDAWIQNETNESSWDLVKKTCAVFALFGYGDQVFSAQSFLADIAKLSTVIMGVKLCIVDACKPSLPPQAPKPHHIRHVEESVLLPKDLVSNQLHYVSQRPVQAFVIQESIFHPPTPILHQTVVHHYPTPLSHHQVFSPIPCSRSSSYSSPSRAYPPPTATQPKPVAISDPPRPSMLCRPSVW